MRDLNSMIALAVAGMLLILSPGPGQAQEPDAAQLLEQARTQVLQGLKLSDQSRAGVSEYFFLHGVWPDSTDEVRGPGPLSGPSVDSIEVIRGTILIRFSTDAADGVAGRQLALRPTVQPNQVVVWACGHAESKGADPESGPAELLATDVEADLLPERCR